MSYRKPRDSLKCNLISSCNDLFAMRNKCFFSCSARILKWHVASGKFCFIHMLAVKIVCLRSLSFVLWVNPYKCWWKLAFIQAYNGMLSIPLLCSYLSKKKKSRMLSVSFLLGVTHWVTLHVAFPSIGLHLLRWKLLCMNNNSENNNWSEFGIRVTPCMWVLDDTQ